MNHLEWVFVRSQEPFIVAPTFDEGETARLARRVCQRVNNILRDQLKEKNYIKIFKNRFTSLREPGRLSGRRRRRRRAGYLPPRLLIPWRTTNVNSGASAAKDEPIHGTAKKDTQESIARPLWLFSIPGIPHGLFATLGGCALLFWERRVVVVQEQLLFCGCSSLCCCCAIVALSILLFLFNK